MAFCTAQQINRPFGISNLTSLIICSCIAGHLVNDLKVGIYIFPICKFVVEITNSLAVLYSLIFKIEKGSLMFIKIKDIFGKHCKEFMVTGFKFILSTYTEYIGFEFNILLAGITHDQNQIAAFVSWTNFTDIVFRIGMGFSNVTRTKVANYIGAKQPIKAKNLQLLYFFLVSIIGFIMFTVIMLLKSKICDIYTKSPEIHECLQNIMDIYTIGAISEIMTNTLNITLRITNRVNQTIYITTFCYIIE